MSEEIEFDDFKRIFGLNTEDKSVELFGGPSSNFFTQPPEPSYSGGAGIKQSRSDSIWFGDNLGNAGHFIESPPEEVVIALLEQYLPNLKEEHGVDDWMQLTLCVYQRRASYYHELKKKIYESEQILYESPESTTLKKGYKAIVTHQLFFNILRANCHLDDNVETADKIFDNFFEEWVAADPNRQVTMLMHCYMNFICRNDWPKAADSMKRAWTALRMMENSDRFNLGGWEDWTTMLLVMWYFQCHIPEFGQEMAGHLSFHNTLSNVNRRELIVAHLTPRMVIDFTGELNYKRATELNTALPKLEEENEEDNQPE